mmetsp:Transcript_15156/g.44376  ORF Transcript_15156/g.44376 Transcript_15156/m.44376 type:complete len:356 (-) Transcript_15156:178-1245(-)
MPQCHGATSATVPAALRPPGDHVLCALCVMPEEVRLGLRGGEGVVLRMGELVEDGDDLLEGHAGLRRLGKGGDHLDGVPAKLGPYRGVQGDVLEHLADTQFHAPVLGGHGHGDRHEGCGGVLLDLGVHEPQQLDELRKELWHRALIEACVLPVRWHRKAKEVVARAGDHLRGAGFEEGGHAGHAAVGDGGDEAGVVQEAHFQRVQQVWQHVVLLHARALNEQRDRVAADHLRSHGVRHFDAQSAESLAGMGPYLLFGVAEQLLEHRHGERAVHVVPAVLVLCDEDEDVRHEDTHSAVLIFRARVQSGDEAYAEEFGDFYWRAAQLVDHRQGLLPVHQLLGADEFCELWVCCALKR